MRDNNKTKIKLLQAFGIGAFAGMFLLPAYGAPHPEQYPEDLNTRRNSS